MVYASQGSYQTAVYDPCTKCGGSGRIKDRDPHQNPTPMSFIDSVSAIMTLAVSLFICWHISETEFHSELSMNGKFTLMAASFIFSFFGAAAIFALPSVQKLMSWIFGLAILLMGIVILF
ncbi:MAG: hypothetical protein ACK4NR_12145 [Micavibrio sp.]